MRAGRIKFRLSIGRAEFSGCPKTADAPVRITTLLLKIQPALAPTSDQTAVRHFPRMTIILLICGLTIAGLATWRGYASARSVLGPFLHGEPTRSAVEATQRLTERPRVLLAARRTLFSICWLVLGMRGLFLVVEATRS